MNWTIQQIRQAFSGRLIGKSKMKTSVCGALLYLPADMVKNITNCVWFISSPDDAWAFTFRGSDIKDQHLVFLSDELFEETKEKIEYTILHEIGHVILKHRNSMGYRQSQTEIRQQELQADRFAKKYLFPAKPQVRKVTI